jgi:excisionase family DNA binding protein
MKKKRLPRLMTVEELADYLGLQKQTIYNWLHQKKISGIKIGKVWRFNRTYIDKWLKDMQK